MRSLGTMSVCTREAPMVTSMVKLSHPFCIVTPMVEIMGILVTQPGWGTDPNHGWRMGSSDALSEIRQDLRARSADALANLGREMAFYLKT
jgi:hypothetical protein